MDLSFNEGQRILKSTARSFFEGNCPMALVRDLEGKSPGYSREMWRKMADLQWLGITYPESRGGMGLGLLDQFVLYEEMGRVLAPTPHLSSVVLAGETILEAGNASQMDECVKIAEGDSVVATAIIEPNGIYGPGGIALSAGIQGRHCHLNGVKLLVPYADVADAILCVARTANAGDPAEGITLFLIDRATAGIGVEPLQTTSGLSLFAVSFDNVQVSDSTILGRPDHGWKLFARIVKRASVLQCAEIIGAAQRVLELVTAYAKERVQFGRPIGVFQAVQYLCTDVAIDYATTSLLARQAAWRIDEGLPHDREVAIAKAAASAAAHHMTRQAQEVFAGVGFMLEHDIQLYTRRAKHWELNLGDAAFHYEALAQAMDL